jgi:hypothetical protein
VGSWKFSGLLNQFKELVMGTGVGKPNGAGVSEVNVATDSVEGSRDEAQLPIRPK